MGSLSQSDWDVVPSGNDPIFLWSSLRLIYFSGCSLVSTGELDDYQQTFLLLLNVWFQNMGCRVWSYRHFLSAGWWFANRRGLFYGYNILDIWLTLRICLDFNQGDGRSLSKWSRCCTISGVKTSYSFLTFGILENNNNFPTICN